MSLRAGTQRDIAFQEYAANAAMMSAAEWHEECEAQSVERSNAAANAAMKCEAIPQNVPHESRQRMEE